MEIVREKLEKLDPRVKRTKHRIRVAFVNLLMKKDISEITVTELAQAADINRKTFYVYYATPSDIWKEMQAEIAQQLQALLFQSSDFQLATFLQGLNQILGDDMTFFKLITMEKDYAYLLSDCINLLRTKLLEKYHQPIKVTYAAAGIINVYAEWLRNGQVEPLTTLTQQLEVEIGLTFANKK